MRINNNMMSVNTQRQLSVNNANVSKSVEKLSSGLRINRAGDDAAGLAISEKMRSQIRGLDQATRNSQDAISLVQTAEGALSETHAILQRMRELSVQSASDTNQVEDRAALDAEFKQLQTEMSKISQETKFNDMELLDGSFGVAVDTATTAGHSTALAVDGVAGATASGAAGETYTFSVDATNLYVTNDAGTQITVGTLASVAGAGSFSVAEFGITMNTGAGFDATDLAGTAIQMAADGSGTIQTGANAGETMDISIGDMSAEGLSVAATDINISTRTNASLALTAVDVAIKSVSEERAMLGAYQNRLEHKIANLNTSSENLQAAESRIRDVDMAKEMSTYTKNNILSQAATAMLAQANNAPQSVLQLLR